MSQQILSMISWQIDKLLLDAKLDNKGKAELLLSLAQKYQPQDYRPSEQHFDELRTDDYNFQLVNLEFTPQKEKGNSQIRLEQLSSAALQNSRSADMHRLSSELKQITCHRFQSKGDEKKKRRKEKYKSMLIIVAQCFQMLINTIYRAYSHLVCIKGGKSNKYRAQAIYLQTLKKYQQQYLNKTKIITHTQELTDLSIDFSKLLFEKVPSFESKFIDLSEEVIIPLTSSLFKTLII